MVISQLQEIDKDLFALITEEKKRQELTLQMIPSENIAPPEIMAAVGSILCNKYSEGYPSKRYYQGNEFIDKIETLAIERTKRLFGVPYANVQPLSGSPANSIVQFTVLEKDDVIMGLELNSGGHLTHGHPKVTFSGKYFTSIQYTVGKDGLIDYEELRRLALKHKPPLIISGTTAYARTLDFERFGKIADEIGAWHLADISHIAGLVATGHHPSPVPYAHIVTLTTHKTLRGPRGAVILVTEKGLEKDQDLGEKINKSVIPGMQGGPHNHTIAGIAVAMKNAETEEFKAYSSQILKNAKALERELKNYGFNLVTGGTDNHLLLIDLTNKNIDGWCAAWALEYAGIICNKNSIPFEKRSNFYPSGIRLGTPAITTRGMKEDEMVRIASLINKVISEAAKSLTPSLDSQDADTRSAARKNFKKEMQETLIIKEALSKVADLCREFPI